MKLIAAAKLRVAQKKMSSARLFSQEVEGMLRLNTSPDFESASAGREDLFIIISANRGLCGAYNTAIVKLLKKTLAEVIKEENNFKLLFVGSKAYDILKKEFKQNTIQVIKNDQITFRETKIIIDNLITKFPFKTCQVFYTHYKNSLSFTPSIIQLLPFPKIQTSLIDYTYEPDKKSVINYIKKEYLYAMLYQAITESITSEYMSRMLAMDNASRNCEQVISKLTLQYNKLRQNKITTELTEIISGAEAS